MGMMMKKQFYQVDAFSKEPFGGNPAAVVLLEEPMPDSWMQAVAIEMNLSETAFLLGKENRYSLRWFTPKIEVDLCGHATLASAHILFEHQLVQSGAIAIFETASGELKACQEDGRIELDFPAFEVIKEDSVAQAAEALHHTPKSLHRSGENLMAVFESEDEIRTMEPDFDAVAALSCQGVIVTSESADGRYDFISRYFAPRVGINEDPVTGSAHCSLAPYWAEVKGKNQLHAYQASTRGGVLWLRLDQDRVFISGDAVTIMSGEILA
jgi:PhzF family phenazine biosynthesis protein